jgi:hypothetical protein
MENYADLMQRLLEIQNGERRSPKLIAEDERERAQPEAEAAFKGTRDATENLIERGFVRGERLKGVDGIYFKDLKLTPDGERTAISRRKEVENLKKELPELVKYADSVAAEVDHFEKKNTTSD